MIRFEWDDWKAKENIRKHGIKFEDAVSVFDDPLMRLIFQGIVKGEERWLAIGTARNFLLLLVVHTSEETADTEIVRIISARKLENHERGQYEHR
jgi:uncharacterized DUF497 family protein